MRLANVAGRAAIVQDGMVYDVERCSAGRFGPDLPRVFLSWQEFRAWAAGCELAGGTPLTASALGAPSPKPVQVFGIGLNYRAHAVESGLSIPEVPLVFAKFPTSILGPVGTIPLPGMRVDWEVELAAVIGQRAYRVTADEAWSHVAGVTGAQDISDRDVQMQPAAMPQFSLGKSFPGFTPLGPVLVTPDELADPDDVPLTCRVNAATVQQSSTADLIFSVPRLIEYLSSVLPLLPGDIILTGTPSGVGLGRRPPRFLAPGDVLMTEVGGIGQMRHECTQGLT